VKVQQLTAKVYADAPGLDLEELIPVWHRWIQETRLPDTLLIDVVDYRHVVDGPGVMLIGDGVHYALDQQDGRLGLLVSRKRDPDGDAGDKLAEILARAFEAASALEKDPSLAGSLSFRAGDVRVQVGARRAARNDEAGAAAFRPHVEAAAATLYPGAAVTVARDSDDPRALLGFRVQADTGDDSAALAGRLKPAPAGRPLRVL
jgi:hypothetical protein